MRIEYWKGCPVRWIELEGDWYCVLKDACESVGIKNARDARTRLPQEYISKATVGVTDFYPYVTSELPTPHSRARHTQEMILVNYKGLYYLFARSQKYEAQAFMAWVWDVIDKFRRDSGLEQYQVHHVMDREFQYPVQSREWDGEKWIVTYLTQNGDVWVEEEV